MMNSGKTTIARPYVAAAFEYAVKMQDMRDWEAMLKKAAFIAKNPSITTLLASPKVTEDQLADLFCDLLAAELNPERKNFIRLLALNGRLMILPEIATLFALARATQEKTMTVEVTSATPLDYIYQQKLTKALTARLQRQVTLQCEVDPSLLGGVLVRSGDRVFDGSIRGKLTRLLESL